MMFGPRASPRVLARAALARRRRGGAIRTVTAADRVGPLAERVDVVGEQPRMAVEDAGERLVDRRGTARRSRRCPRPRPASAWSPAAMTTAPRLRRCCRT